MIQSEFDFEESERRKRDGKKRAAKANPLLQHARKLAEKIGQLQDEVSADDVVAALIEEGHGIHALGNSTGSLFHYSDSPWEWTGRRIKSARKHAHANELKTWRLKR